MRPNACRLLVVTLCVAALAVAPASAQINFPDTATVPAAAPSAALPIAVVGTQPFNTIQVCVPVNVLVVPSNGTNYTVTGQAESSVLQALVPVVANGTLQLQSNGNFSTGTSISLQVSQDSPFGMVTGSVAATLLPDASSHTLRQACSTHAT